MWFSGGSRSGCELSMVYGVEINQGMNDSKSCNGTASGCAACSSGTALDNE